MENERGYKYSLCCLSFRLPFFWEDYFYWKDRQRSSWTSYETKLAIKGDQKPYTGFTRSELVNASTRFNLF